MAHLLAKQSAEQALPAADLERVVAHTKGFSGSDLNALCREAALGPVRELMRRSGGIRGVDAAQVRPIGLADFGPALRQIRASVSQGTLQAYREWDAQYGSAGTGL